MKKKLYVVIICLIGILNPIFAQQTEITGTVSDSSEPLIGVTVKVKGTTRTTVSDLDGNYRIQATQHEILEFTYIGYKPLEVVVGNRKVINVVMEGSQTDLGEVVVIGYGTARKSDLTGAISSVKADDLIATPASSVSEMLRGKAPGVQVTLNSGRPGSGSSLLIRGSRSLTGGNDPLYIVDGIPLDGGINELNAQDIASIEILKDAASQSIYGARAANGVIFITTKRGKAGKVVVDYSGYAGIQRLSRNFDFYNGEEWYALRREARRTSNGGEYPETIHDVLQDRVMEEVYENKKFVNWEDLMIKSAWLTKHDLSVRGGSENMKAALAIGHYYQDGMVSPADYQRSNFRLNLDWDLNKFLTVGSNISFSRSTQNIEDGAFSEFITRSPISRPFDENGNPTKYIDDSSTPNPLYKIQESESKTSTDKLDLSVFAILKPFKGFSYRVNASLNKYDRENGDYKTANYPGGKSNGSISYSYNDRLILENIVNYDIKYKTVHDLNFTLIQSIDKSRSRSVGFNAEGSTFDDLSYNGLVDASVLKSGIRGFTERNLVSFAGRVRYNLMDKYLLNLSVRRDGSSVFGNNNKWGNFPSASLAWRINEENFLKNTKWISSLKLRASYGSVGNQAISPYRSLGLVNDYPMLFGDQLIIGFLPTSELKNPNIKWESTTSANIGLDWGIFKQRVTLSFDYYFTKTKDLLVTRELPQAIGYTQMLDNLGETKTQGFDIVLNGDIIRQKDFILTAGINFSKIKSEIVRIDERVDVNGKPLDNPGNNWYIGQPINVYYDYKFDGIYQTSDFDENGKLKPGIPGVEGLDSKPGDIKLKDIDGNGEITTEDRIFYQRDPDWFGTFTTNVYYKGFDLYLELYNTHGGFKRNAYLYDANSGGSLQGKLNGMKVDYWTPENPSNSAPRPDYDTNPKYQQTLGYQDASYFRLRTLTLGYTFPAKWTRKASIEKLRLYCTATNLYTKTDFKSYSPELNPGQYPEPKQVVFGVNLSF